MSQSTGPAMTDCHSRQSTSEIEEALGSLVAYCQEDLRDDLEPILRDLISNPEFHGIIHSNKPQMWLWISRCPLFNLERATIRDRPETLQRDHSHHDRKRRKRSGNVALRKSSQMDTQLHAQSPEPQQSPTLAETTDLRIEQSVREDNALRPEDHPYTIARATSPAHINHHLNNTPTEYTNMSDSENVCSTLQISIDQGAPSELSYLDGDERRQAEWWYRAANDSHYFPGGAISVIQSIIGRKHTGQRQQLLLYRILAQQIEKELQNIRSLDTPGLAGNSHKSRVYKTILSCYNSMPGATVVIKSNVFQRHARLAAKWSLLHDGYVLHLGETRVSRWERMNEDDFKHANDYIGTLLNESQSNLASLEKQLIATFTKNFLNSTAHDAEKLSLLLYYLDYTSFPSGILFESGSLVKRWSQDGQLIDIQAKDDGLESEITILIQDKERLSRGIEILKQRALNFHSSSLHKRTENYADLCLGKGFSDEKERSAYYKVILLHLLRIFPLDQMTDANYGAKGRKLRPHLQRLFGETQLYTETVITFSKAQKELLVAVLLSSSRFSDQGRPEEKMVPLTAAAALLRSPELSSYLYYWMWERLAFVGQRSDKAIEKIQEGLKKVRVLEQSDTYALLRVHKALLLKQGAELSLMSPDLTSALAKVTEAKSLLLHSALESHTRLRISITEGKILRYRGKFDESRLLLESVLETWKKEGLPTQALYFLLISEYACTLCESSRWGPALSLINDELKAFAPEQLAQQSGRRLRLVLAELHFHQGELTQAERYYQELLHYYSSSPSTALRKLDILDKNGYLQTVVGLAKISHFQSDWFSARRRWDDAEKVLSKHKMGNGWYVQSMIHACQQIVALHSRTGEARTPIDAQSLNFLLNSKAEYWLLGIGAWFEYIQPHARDVLCRSDVATALDTEPGIIE